MVVRRGIGIGLGIFLSSLSLLGARMGQHATIRPAMLGRADQQSVMKQGPQATHPHLQWVDMTSAQHGWALNRRDRLLVTWNGGHTWNRTPVIHGGYTDGLAGIWNATQVQGFYALNSRDAWDNLYRTTNGGRTWVKLQAPGGGLARFSHPRTWLAAHF